MLYQVQQDICYCNHLLQFEFRIHDCVIEKDGYRLFSVPLCERRLLHCCIVALLHHASRRMRVNVQCLLFECAGWPHSNQQYENSLKLLIINGFPGAHVFEFALMLWSQISTTIEISHLRLYTDTSEQFLLHFTLNTAL